MNKEKLKQNIIKVVNNLEVFHCIICKKIISKKEYENGEKACFKCWEK